MSARNLTVLGTASQFPTKTRNHNGYFLRWDRHGLLFDPGEGTQQHLMRAGISASKITRILITHFHGDHCFGLAGVVQRLSADRVAHRVEVHYPASGEDFFGRLRRASIYCNQSNILGCPIRESGPVYEDDQIVNSTQELDHSVETYGYRVEEKDRRSMLPAKVRELGVTGPAVGALKQEGRIAIGGRFVTLDEVSEVRSGQSLAVVLDTRLCDGARKLADGADLLLCEATYLRSEDRPAENVTHMTAQEAARLASEAGARYLLLTHFSSRYDDLSEFEEIARAIHADTRVAREGMVVEVRR